MKVLELTSNPQVDTRALKECIENDPALTSKVLRVVNSSLFGLSREVSDLNQALALLGTKPLKLLVLGFSLPGGLFNGVEAQTLGWYWRHTLTKAVAAREIAETAWSRAGDEAFIAGLLQDLGLLLLIQELGEPYAEFLEKVLTGGDDLLALETEAMGFDHTMLTARLLAHWGLPDALVETVRWRPDGQIDETTSPSQRRLIQILRLAELVTRLVAAERPDVLGELLETGQREHDLSPEEISALVETLEEKVRQLADVLSLQLPEGLDYRDVLTRAHGQLAEVAASAAEEMVHSRASQASLASRKAALADEAGRLSSALAQFSRRPAEPLAVAAAPRCVAPIEPDPVAAATFGVARGSRPGIAEADPGFLGRLGASVAACRQARCSLSLLLVELGHPEDLMMTLGLEGFQELWDRLEDACHRIDHPRALCVPHGEAGFAIILPDCERQVAVRLGNQLIDRFRRLVPGDGPAGHPAACLGMGAATVSLPPKNFPARDLLVSADRCLYGSHASGGGVKSIEIY
jgi:HD-like signal output (HDOD) protein